MQSINEEKHEQKINLDCLFRRHTFCLEKIWQQKGSFLDEKIWVEKLCSI